MIQDTTQINNKYNLIANCLKTGSNNDFNKLARAFKNNIESLIKSAARELNYSRDLDIIYSNVLSVLWRKCPKFKLDQDKGKGVNSFFKFIKLVAYNNVKSQKDQFIKRSKRNQSVDANDCFGEIQDDHPQFDDTEEMLAYWRDQLPADLRTKYDLLVDYNINEYSADDICHKYNLRSYQAIHNNNFQVRQVLNKFQAN